VKRYPGHPSLEGLQIHILFFKMKLEVLVFLQKLPVSDMVLDMYLIVVRVADVYFSPILSFDVCNIRK